MEQQTASEACITWENRKNAVDDSEPLTGELVENDEGLLTIYDRDKQVYHVVVSPSGRNAPDTDKKLVTTYRSLNDRKRDGHVKGIVTGIDVSL